MKKSYTHRTNFGSFAPDCIIDPDGFIGYHNSTRYSSATEEQLAQWTKNGPKLVCAAVEIERTNRAIRKNQN